MDISYQALQVKQYDRDRYICCLFANDALQEKLFNILAFNAEIASIAEQTSELAPALLRITWWQDAIDNLYQGKIYSHPLLQSLNKIIIAKNIPKSLFSELLEARMIELYQENPKNLQELVIFAEKTGANLLEIMARSIDATDINKYKALGIAWSLLGILRSSEYTKGFLLDFENREAIVKQVIRKIEYYLAKIDPKSLTKSTAAIDLLFFLSHYYLKILKKADYNITSDKLIVNPVVKQLYLLYKYIWLRGN